MTVVQPEIELHQITKTFYIGSLPQTILKGVDLSVYSGELMAIMGTSGSGKSTLMNILGLLDRPTSGQYLLKGQDVTAISEDERAELRNKTIGFVFQSFFLLPRLTVIQNVGLPLYYRGTSEHETTARSLKMLEKVGLANLAYYRPNRLSGGQQQRVAVARALVANPLMILADEPTGALDTATGQMIMDLFKELNEQEKVTFAIITHDPRIAKQCKRTVHIKDGLIIEPPEDSAH